MRLTPTEVETISDAAHRYFGARCTIRLFGSRADDARRGGDIDLHVEAESAERANLSAELAFRAEIRDRLDQRVDVIVRAPGDLGYAIDAIALRDGVRLP